MSEKMPMSAWAIVERSTGKLAIFDGRCPVYWNRRVANLAAGEQGLKIYASDRDHQIVRVEVRRIVK